MTDNISVGGSTIATDEVTIGSTSVHAQRVKTGFGVDGSWTETSSTNPLPVIDNPNAAGGATLLHLVGAADTNATSIKASAGTLYAVHIVSIDATPIYVKFYNDSSAPTVGTDTPVAVLGCPGSTSGTLGATASYTYPKGAAFSTGIAMGIVTGITDASTGALTVSEVIVSVEYK